MNVLLLNRVENIMGKKKSSWKTISLFAQCFQNSSAADAFKMRLRVDNDIREDQLTWESIKMSPW